MNYDRFKEDFEDRDDCPRDFRRTRFFDRWIVFLTTPPVPPGLTVTTGEVTDHNLKTSIKVTLEGKNDSYRMTMFGPEGTEVDSEFITQAQMADGNQSVWMELMEDPESFVSAQPGTYSLVVTNSSGSKVCEKNFGPLGGI